MDIIGTLVDAGSGGEASAIVGGGKKPCVADGLTTIGGGLAGVRADAETSAIGTFQAGAVPADGADGPAFHSGATLTAVDGAVDGSLFRRTRAITTNAAVAAASSLNDNA